MFAFAQIEPRSRAVVTQPEIPLGRFLGAAWDQGVHDSMAASLYRVSEQWQMEHDVSFWGALDQQAGRMLSPEEANDRYGTKLLRFQQPTYEGVARLLRDRHDENQRRALILSNGATSAGRIAASFGTSMVASLLNPVDFSTMFVPIVGEEAVAAKLGLMGAGRARQILARGLITSERLKAAVPAPRLIGAVIEGTVGQAIAEVPLYVSNRMDQTPYTLSDSAVNVLAGGAFAGAIRLGIDAAGAAIRRVRPETRTAMSNKAMNDFLTGKDIDVRKIAKLDDNLIEDAVKFDESLVRGEAELAVDRQIGQETRETGRFGSVDQPNLIRIAQDWIPLMEKQGKDVTLIKRLLDTVIRDVTVPQTERGPLNRVIDLQNLARLLDLRFDPMERSMPEAYRMAESPERERMMRAAGLSPEDLKVLGQLSNAERRQQAAAVELRDRERVERVKANEKERRVREFVDEARRNFEAANRPGVENELKPRSDDRAQKTLEILEKRKPSGAVTDQDLTAVQKDLDELRKDPTLTQVEPEKSGDAEAETVKPGEAQKQPGRIDVIKQALEKLKIETDPNARYSGVPPEVWNAFIDLVIKGVEAGERLYIVVERSISEILGGERPKNLAEYVAFPKVGDVWFNGRKMGTRALKEGELLWLTDNESIAKEYATEFAGGNQMDDFHRGYVTRYQFTRGLKAATETDLWDVMMALGKATLEDGEITPNEISPKGTDTAGDYLYDPEVLAELKKRGFNSALLSDIFLNDEISAAVLFDPTTQVRALDARTHYPEYLKQRSKKFKQGSALEQEIFGKKTTEFTAQMFRDKIYDTVAELRPAAMMSPEELAKDIDSMIAAAQKQETTGKVGRGTIHPLSYGPFDTGNIDLDELFNSEDFTAGFITPTQRFVTRDEAEWLSGAYESYNMMYAYPEGEMMRDAILSGEVESHSSFIEKSGIPEDVLRRLKKSASDARRNWANMHRGAISHNIGNNLPVSAEAVREYGMERYVPGNYVQRGDLLMPTDANLSKALEDQLLLDNLRNCIVK